VVPSTRFSRRLPDVLEPNALARAVARARAGSVPLLDLTVSNPTAVGISYARTLIDSLADPGAVQYEPSARGLVHAREAIARDYARRNLAADPERILLTASTSEAYSFIFKLLCDPGDEVLVPAPGYPLFEHLTAMEAVKARPYRLDYHGVWSIDLEAFRGSFGERTKAALVVSPNNPTGSLLRAPQWPELRDACERQGAVVDVDTLRLPLPADEGSFDLAVLDERTERPDSAPALPALVGALGDALRPGGRLIVLLPAGRGLLGRLFGGSQPPPGARAMLELVEHTGFRTARIVAVVDGVGYLEATRAGA
jgi:hypothetical protein